MFQLELRDTDDTLVAYINNKVRTISWEWLRVGGCGACQFQLKENFDGSLADDLQEDYSIRAYIDGTLWYSGFIDRISPRVTGKDETITVSALGYVNQLKRIIIDEQTYSGLEIGAVIRNIVEVYGTSATSVTSAANDYDDSGFSADSLYFNESIYDSIVKAANIAGHREWGVDANKAFFCKTRDNSITKYYFIKQDFASFQPVRDFNPMVTKIFLTGSAGYKKQFSVTNKVSTRMKSVTNSAITTQSVGQQYARMYLKEHGAVKRSYVGKLVNQNTRIEATVPIGRAGINVKIGVNYLYDVATQLYDSGLKYDGGTEAYQIEKVKYTLTDSGVNTTLYFGPVPPSIVDELAQLQHLIDTERIKT